MYARKALKPKQLESTCGVAALVLNIGYFIIMNKSASARISL